MKEYPILFTAAMVNAILSGRKTQTRRVVKQLDPAESACTTTMNGAPMDGVCWAFGGPIISCPYGRPGAQLWVRETWQHSNFPAGPFDPDCDVFYRADYMDDPHGPDGELSPEGRYRSWKPSIHMPRAASRIQLQVSAVRVERLQDCSEADAKAEGVMPHIRGGWHWHKHDPNNVNDWHQFGFKTAVLAYQGLWESINGAGSWDVNPWVWVVEFSLVRSERAA